MRRLTPILLLAFTQLAAFAQGREAFGPDGRIYRIQAASITRSWPDGSVPETIAQGLHNPSDLIVGEDGALFVKETPQGKTHKLVVGSQLDWESSRERGLALDADLPPPAWVTASQVGTELSLPEEPPNTLELATLSPEQLSSHLGHPDRRVRLNAATLLAEGGTTEHVQWLLKSTRSEVLSARRQALWGIGIAARKQPVLLSTLVSRLTDEEPEVQCIAATVLGDFRVATAANALLDLLLDATPSVRAAAAVALSRIPSQGLPASSFERALETNPKEANVLALAWAKQCSVDEILASGRTATHKTIRLGAVLALRQLAAPECAEFFADTDPHIATEAVRAVYDLNINLEQAGRPPLRSWLEKLPTTADLYTPGLVHRVLEGALRSGTPADAAAVAGLAAAPQAVPVPNYARLLALKKLAQWDNPPESEAVWGRSQPCPPRAAGIAREAIQNEVPKLKSWANGELLSLAKEVEASFGTPKPLTELVAAVKDETVPLAVRVDSLKLLAAKGRGAEPGLSELCRSLRLKESVPPALRVQARDVLIDQNPSEALALIVEALTVGSAPEKQRAVAILSNYRGDDGKRLLLRLGIQLIEGTLDPAIHVEVIEAAHKFDAKRGIWRKVIDRWQAGLNLNENPFEVYRQALQHGNAEKGAAIFRQSQGGQCYHCHETNGRAAALGPDLQGVAKRLNREDLLLSLLQPSAKIALGFGLVDITLTDNSVIEGTLLAESPLTVTLGHGTDRQEIPRAKIKTISAPESPMPPMGAALTLRELRDVMSYLETLR